MIKFKKISKEKPFMLLKDFYEKADDKNQKNIDAMHIASYSKNIQEVDGRFVNLKIVEDKKFIFFTNYNSPKATQFESHGQIAATFFWHNIDTQIRIKGKIKKVSKSFSDSYFKNRSLEKNALAISSNQSKKIKSYELVIKNYNETYQNINLTNRPDYWGGYFFTPYQFEFWVGHPSRVNKRILYDFEQNQWNESLIQP